MWRMWRAYELPSVAASRDSGSGTDAQIPICGKCQGPIPEGLALQCPDVAVHTLCYECVEIELRAHVRDSMQLWNGGNCRFCCPMCKKVRHPAAGHEQCTYQYQYTKLAAVVRKELFRAYVSRMSLLFRRELSRAPHTPNTFLDPRITEHAGDALWELGVSKDDNGVDCLRCKCSICLVDGHSRGLHCRECGGDGDCHFVCSTCVVDYAQAHCRADGTAATSPHGKLHCPRRRGFDSVCDSEAYCMYELARMVGEKEFVELLRAEQRHIECECLREEQVQERATSGTVEGLVHHIREEILTLKCPNRSCQQAFVDFDGCFAISCGRCSTHFCGWCMRVSETSNDSHAHVRRCSVAHHNGHSYTYFGLFSDFERAQAGRRLRLVDEYFAKMKVPENKRLRVTRILHSEFESLGMLKGNARDAYPDEVKEIEDQSGGIAYLGHAFLYERDVEERIRADEALAWRLWEMMQQEEDVPMIAMHGVPADRHMDRRERLASELQEQRAASRRKARERSQEFSERFQRIRTDLRAAHSAERRLELLIELQEYRRTRRKFAAKRRAQIRAEQCEERLVEFCEMHRDARKESIRRQAKVRAYLLEDRAGRALSRESATVYHVVFLDATSDQLPASDDVFRDLTTPFFRRRCSNRLRSAASSMICSTFSSSSSTNRVIRRLSAPRS